MSDLHHAARAAGLIWEYRDGAGRMQCAPDASIDAVLSALATDAPDLSRCDSRAVTAGVVLDLGAGDWVLTLDGGERLSGTGPLPPLPVGYHRLDRDGGALHLLAAPDALPPAPRRWGVTTGLFALWQGTRGGLGDYHRLGDLAAGLAGHGAAFVGINPIHAGFPEDPDNFSPYAPSHRRRLNVLHIAAGAEMADTGDLIDHASAIPAQRAALARSYAGFAGDPAFDAWRADQGAALEQFATHQALSEVFGPYWSTWPAAMQDPASAAVRDFARAHPDRLRFHAWAQWTAETQLCDAQARARAAGMAFGLYLDLAVGTHPHGAETWAERAVFARGVSLGAPPDLLGPSGQRWGLAPMRPDVLRATGFAALAQTLRAQLRFCGLLRLDHILGFERSFWLPDGLPGLYVAMPRAEMLAVLRIEASRANGGAGAPVIGEDLGTIPDGLRAALAEAGVMGCRVAMFERDWQGTGAFLPGTDYTPTALASWGTHDLPTWAGWRAGRDLDWRERFAELPDPAAARATRSAEVAALDAVTGGSDLHALHAHLATCAAQLVAVQAEDLCGAVEQANLPGTVHEHPNWRRRLPMPISGLIAAETLRDTARQMADAGRNQGPTP